MKIEIEIDKDLKVEGVVKTAKELGAKRVIIEDGKISIEFEVSIQITPTQLPESPQTELRIPVPTYPSPYIEPWPLVPTYPSPYIEPWPPTLPFYWCARTMSDNSNPRSY